MTKENIFSKNPLNISTNIISKASLIFSLYVPLGENGIIQLNDKFRGMNDVKILETDLYYHLKIIYQSYTVELYSRGLITFELTRNEFTLIDLFNEANKALSTIYRMLKELITDYNLSMVDVLGTVDKIPVHKTILVDHFANEAPGTVINLEYLESLIKNPDILNFIGDPRSINSVSYEDVIIGTNGSIVRSDAIDTMLSFHAYNRALHLFLGKYNLIIEKVWNDLNTSEDQVRELDNYIMNTNLPKKRFRDRLHVFASDRRKRLGKTRHDIFQRMKHIDNFLVLTKFIAESIEFTENKYLEIVNTGEVKLNSFHIRKTLTVLDDRAKHLTIVSESFIIRGKMLISQLDLYDSEIASETEQRLETIAFLIGLIGMVLALLAIFVEIS